MKRRSEQVGIARKKRKWVRPVVVAASVITVFIVACFILLAIMAKKELGFSVGRYLVTDDGVSMVVMDDAPDSIKNRSERERYMSPVVMTNRTERDLFKKLDTGDKILFVHGGVKESYPGGTGVYAVFKLDDGGIGDIPGKVLNDLTAMGWIGPVVSMDEGFPDWGLTLSVKDVTPSGLTLVCTKNGGNPTGELMCGEDYQLITLKDGTWKTVPTVIANYGFNSMGYRISEGTDTEFEIDWEWLYGKLTAGTYRLTKSFMDRPEPDDYETATYWVEFQIEN